ncbi:MAG: GntR family transcriptional regulator, partial [Opitutaceae bacterium]|nr:GntR family transcriptional regulator [Cytophagales bacterium]
YVFIQFGHNDESKQKVERYTSVEDFKKNLTFFVNKTIEKNGIPVLLSPVSRRSFDSTGHVVETHKEYTEAVQQVAIAEKVAFIDLDKKSRELYQQMGPEYSKLLFNWLSQDEHPNYPEGKKDNTHFNELGARKIAQLILQEIKTLQLPLKDKIIKPKTK